jgi:flagellar biosynthetic protein FliO
MLDAEILKTFFTLGASVAALALILYFVKKYSKKRNNSQSSFNVQVLSRTTLQPKTQIYTIKVAERTLLVGVTDHNISTLADLSSKENNINADLPAIKQLPVASRNSNKIINHTNLQKQTVDDSLSFKAFLKSTIKKN